MKILLISLCAASSSLAMAQDHFDNWRCTSEVVGKTETLDNGFTYCRQGGDWACFFKIRETCKSDSGDTTTRDFEQFRFCSQNLSDCF